MKAAVKNEVVKLFTHKKYIVFMVIGAIFSVLNSFLGTMLKSGLTALGSWEITMNIGFTPTAALPLSANLLLPLLIFMGASDLFTTEFSDLTIKATLIRPIHRIKVYLSKVFAILFYVTLYLGVILVIGEITGFISGAVRTPKAFFLAIAAYALTLVPLFILIVFSALIALLFKSSTFVMFVLIFSMLFLGALSLILPVTRDMLFTNYLLWHKLWLGSVPAFGRMLNICLILFGYGATFTFGGMMIFERRDV